MAEWRAFSHKCQHVEIFEDDTHGPRLRYWFKNIIITDRNAPTVLFPNLRTLRVGLHNVLAFISPSVTSLSIVLTPEMILQDRREMATIVKHLLISLPNVDSLTILGPHHCHKYPDDIIRICHCFKHLSELTFSPSAMHFRVLQSIASIRTLTCLRIAEYYLMNGRSRLQRTSPAVGSNNIKLNRFSFMHLSCISLTVSGPNHFDKLLSARNFPTRSLTTLWARFENGLSYTPDDIYFIFDIVVKHCRLLKSLTLRFCPAQPQSLEAMTRVEVIHYSEFRSFLSLPYLTHFVIDHSLPLYITEDDITHMVHRAARFEVLWLNPFPAIVVEIDEWQIPALHVIQHFARHCPKLRELGLLVDARLQTSQALQGLQFQSLQELFIGRSMIPYISGDNKKETTSAWESIARFLSVVLPRSTKLTTVRDYDTASRMLMGPAMSRMRPMFLDFDGNINASRRATVAWNIVRGMSYELK